MDDIIRSFADITSVPDFKETVDRSCLHTADSLDVLQMNIGRRCNLACKHCHVLSSPARTEEMSKEVMDAALSYAKEQNISTIDITGGAPEMNPNLRYLVEEAAKFAKKVIVRTNLVILLEEGYTDLPEFFAKNCVEIVCSLPYYRAAEMNRVRGDMAFERAITVLRRLNELGYGRDERLVLNLAYNPAGAFFPPDQTAMEKEYKERLDADFGISFNSLYTLYNNPLGRFGAFLARTHNLESYLKKLYEAFNPEAAKSIMCRFQLSVDYEGKIYDCDFNLAAGLPCLQPEKTIFDLLGKPYKKRIILVDKHCYACTAGAGSS